MHPLKAGAMQDGVDMGLYDRFAATIFAYLYRQVASQQDAEDLLLEVFTAAFGNAALSGLTEERQLAWLRQVARNKVIDRYRHAALRVELPLEHASETEDGQLTPEEHAIQRESYERLHQSVQQLPVLQQQLIRLRYGNGLRLAATSFAGISPLPPSAMRW